MWVEGTGDALLPYGATEATSRVTVKHVMLDVPMFFRKLPLLGREVKTGDHECINTMRAIFRGRTGVFDVVS